MSLFSFSMTSLADQILHISVLLDIGYCN